MVAKKVALASEGVTPTWANQHELMMMTSATLIEALYEAVDDHLRELGKSNITEMNPKDLKYSSSAFLCRGCRDNL